MPFWVTKMNEIDILHIIYFNIPLYYFSSLRTPPLLLLIIYSDSINTSNYSTFIKRRGIFNPNVPRLICANTKMNRQDKNNEKPTKWELG